MSDLVLASLSLPAMLGAGVSSSAHCAAMCGLLQRRQGASDAVAGHVGRLTGYMLIGAVAGGAGQWLLRAAAWLPLGEGLRAVALPLLLVVLVLMPSRRGLAVSCCGTPRARVARTSMRQRAIAGFVGALVPCMPLYAAATYAALSVSARTGALLLLAFGVGTIPAVQAGAWAWARLGTRARGVSSMRRGELWTGILASTVLLVWIASTRSIPWCLS